MLEASGSNLRTPTGCLKFFVISFFCSGICHESTSFLKSYHSPRIPFYLTQR
jgi:hypothetical protein